MWPQNNSILTKLFVAAAKYFYLSILNSSKNNQR